MTDTQFREHLRLSRNSFNTLKRIICECDIAQKYFPNDLSFVEDEQDESFDYLPMNRKKRQIVSIEKGLLITLWYLGNQVSMRDIGDRFDVSKSTVHKCVHSICYILTSLTHKFIVWPSTYEDIKTTQRTFNEKGFKGVLGAVDGCHVRIKRSDQNQ